LAPQLVAAAGARSKVGDRDVISVVVVTYNSLAVIGNCLETLMQSELAEPIELIVVDNASTDGTREWLEEFARDRRAHFGPVRVQCLRENIGYAAANNCGIATACGEAILLLNPDTEVSKTALQTCRARLGTQAPGGRTVGAIGCRLVLEDGHLDRACRRGFPTIANSLARFSGLSLLFPRSRALCGYNLTYLDDRGSYPVDCVSGAFLMVLREVIEQAGPLDEDYFMYGEDIDWCYRIVARGFAVWYDGSVDVLHRKGGSGGKRSVDSLGHFYSTMGLYYRKHHGDGWTAAVVRAALGGLFLAHAAALVVRQELADQRKRSGGV